MRDYSEDVKLSKYRLVDCTIEQPQLLGDWGRIEAEKNDERDTAKTDLEAAEAEADLAIRSMTLKEINETYGLKLSKLTEALVAALIKLDPDVKEANKKYLEAKRDAGIARAARSAFESRDQQLTNLTHQHGQGLFSMARSEANARSASAGVARDELKDEIGKEGSGWKNK